MACRSSGVCRLRLGNGFLPRPCRTARRSSLLAAWPSSSAQARRRRRKARRVGRGTGLSPPRPVQALSRGSKKAVGSPKRSPNGL